MIKPIGNKYVKQYFNFSAKPNLKFMIKDSKDVEGNNFKQEVPYVAETRKINVKLIGILSKESKTLMKIVDYIINNLQYNTDNILLIPAEVALAINDDKSNISKALKRLKELNLIERACEREDLKDTKVDKYLYFVNPNYIFFGDAEQLRRDYNEQYGKYNNDMI